jgi:uncharacterized coiled-coil DUF342 family protein
VKLGEPRVVTYDPFPPAPVDVEAPALRNRVAAFEAALLAKSARVDQLADQLVLAREAIFEAKSEARDLRRERDDALVIVEVKSAELTELRDRADEAEAAEAKLADRTTALALLESKNLELKQRLAVKESQFDRAAGALTRSQKKQLGWA